MAETPIRVEKVSKRFGRGSKAVQALQEVSLSVSAGEIYGLLGRNGAGKTTLLKILLDITRADSGELRLRGLSTRDPAARRSVGYLPEDHRLPGYQTGAGALRFYAELSGAEDPWLKKRIPESLELVELENAAGKKIRTFSKGMKQRLGLAQAFIHDPDVLFLDEPTDGVDPVGRAKVRDILLRLKKRGKTIFVSSHLLGETERLCDRAGILNEGRLIREGSIDDLTATERAYVLRTDPRPDEQLIEAIRKEVVSAKEVEEGLEICVEREEDIDRVTNLLRTRGIGIRSLSLKRLSLEEVFLEAVDTKKAKEEGGSR